MRIFQVKVSGSGITGDEFVYRRAVLIEDIVPQLEVAVHAMFPHDEYDDQRRLLEALILDAGRFQADGEVAK